MTQERKTGGGKAGRLVIRHLGWVKGRGEMTLTPTGDGRTHLAWREILQAPLGALGAGGIRAFAPLLRRTFREDLDHLARLAPSP